MFYSCVGEGSKELPDNGTISDHEIVSDQILYTVFKKEGREDWEPIQVQDISLHTSEARKEKAGNEDKKVDGEEKDMA